ncbi:MAG: TraM recognition domain-containing protein [Gemmatimonadota bacterium]|nr:TraM recognition domain-containing protein [Deltaproteobacteria bacterium]MDE2973691.1 TraM recognition domain-containing protein [Gemmatimonadota bacterium]
MSAPEETLRPARWAQTVRAVAWSVALPFAWTGHALTWTAEGVIRAVALLIRWPKAAIFSAGLIVAARSYFYSPFPPFGAYEALDLIAAHSPRIYTALALWHIATPAAGTWLAGYVGLTVWRVWGESGRRGRNWGLLPAWPQQPTDEAPSLVVGEVHHPVDPRQVGLPSWLTIPEKGLYTGVAIFGAVGTGKTSACMYPFAEQLLSWQADVPERRSAALVLEVKGDFCYQVQEILQQAGRSDDYVEIGIRTGRRWNPLSATWLDAYSQAYTISSLVNQLFGKGKEPFWQQAYTNLVRWIIEAHRLCGENQDGWVTLQDIYRCAIDRDALDQVIEAAEKKADVDAGSPPRIVSITQQDAFAHWDKLDSYADWQRDGDAGFAAPWNEHLAAALEDLKVQAVVTGAVSRPTSRQRHAAAIRRWYQHDWLQLSNKLRSTIVEGISVFLSMFDVPEIAQSFCPPKPRAKEGPDAKLHQRLDRLSAAPDLPSLKTLIARGKVLALNMPAGKNPALGRAIGVMLKNAWLQALTLRPAEMKKHPNRYFRPAVFLCDEYQQFASVGEDDPSGDEKSFALTRQSKCIPIVATQSVSSLRAVLGSSESWRALLQTLRTRIFLSLSDDASTQLASSLSGEVERVKSSWSLNETSKGAGVSPLTATVGSGKKDMGWGKRFALQWQALFQPRDFAKLENCQAICLPYDGKRALEATRVYLKPYYLPRDLGYWDAKRKGEI